MILTGIMQIRDDKTINSLIEKRKLFIIFKNLNWFFKSVCKNSEFKVIIMIHNFIKIWKK
jgi:hypothetical protein